MAVGVSGRRPCIYPKDMFLLDTNFLSPERIQEHINGRLFTSSVSAQELLGMQKSAHETGYRYALPLLTHTPGRNWIVDHAKKFPVSKGADRLVVPRSLLRPESLELGHAALAIAHERGHDGLLRVYASQGLHRRMLKPVLDKWEFLRNQIDAVLPLDEEIAAHGVLLADLFVKAQIHVKGTRRNTMNDMLVAATSQVTGLPLVTDDSQLGRFYQQHGWSVVVRNSIMTATPSAADIGGSDSQVRRSGSRGYINRPVHMRKHIDYNRPPVR